MRDTETEAWIRGFARLAVRCPECGMHAVYIVPTMGVCAACAVDAVIDRDLSNYGDVFRAMSRMRICVYCGERACDVEHVIPKSSGLPTYTVPACRECNVLAGAVQLGGFVQKCAYIKQALRRRYRHVLSMPEWDPEELAELGPGLRPWIQQSEKARQIVRERLRWEVELWVADPSMFEVGQQSPQDI